TKGLTGGGTSRTITKSGTGVAQLTAASTMVYGTLRVSGGTLLIDNTSGSGSGHAAVSVGTGATLGGTGIIGGVAGYTVANVVVSGTATDARATVAPGTINATTGTHILGTLTVGSGSQANNVTFGSYSRLTLHFASDGSHDQLTVYGSVNLSGTSDTLELSVPEGTAAGTYTLASATGGISGVFDSVTGLPSGAQLNYTANTLELLIAGEDFLQATLTTGGESEISTILSNTTSQVTLTDNGSLKWTASGVGSPLAFAFKADGTVNGLHSLEDPITEPINIIVSETPGGVQFVVQGTITAAEDEKGVAGKVTIDTKVMESYKSLFIHGLNYED
ncbi:MAG: hypothetical protein PF692_11500, partial [Kiritimatiellae bacterium]|nr:hypothetical protein [Kiritimatiellia bacterium]